MLMLEDKWLVQGIGFETYFHSLDRLNAINDYFKKRKNTTLTTGQSMFCIQTAQL